MKLFVSQTAAVSIFFLLLGTCFTINASKHTEEKDAQHRLRGLIGGEESGDHENLVGERMGGGKMHGGHGGGMMMGQQGRGHGHGHGGGGGMMNHKCHDTMSQANAAEDNDDNSDDEDEMVKCPNRKAMQTIHKLLENRDQIHRTVNMTNTGAHTHTHSKNPQVSGWIQDHVAHMIALVQQDGGRIRCWDPLFAALFDHKDSITAVPTYTEEGVTVSLNGGTPCGVKLVQKHALVLSSFVERGHEEVIREHGVPEVCDETYY